MVVGGSGARGREKRLKNLTLTSFMLKSELHLPEGMLEKLKRQADAVVMNWKLICVFAGEL